VSIWKVKRQISEIKLVRKFIKLLPFIFVFCAPCPLSGVAFSSPPDKLPETKDKSLFLSIVATETQRLELIIKYQQLSKQFKYLRIVSSNDCSNLKPELVFLVSAQSSNKSKIKEALNNAKVHVVDSYMRECKAKPGSFLTYNIPFIDDSILKLPRGTISWSFDDVASQLIPLDDEFSFLVVKKYNGNINDEVEGREASLYLIKNKSSKRLKLLQQCWDFSEPVRKQSLFSFQCMTEMAVNQPVHTIYVYDIKEQKMVFKKSYCQKPEIKALSSVACYGESVNEFGELNLIQQVYKFNLQ